MAEVTTTRTYNLSLTAEELSTLLRCVDDARYGEADGYTGQSKVVLNAICKALLNPDVAEADL